MGPAQLTTQLIERFDRVLLALYGALFTENIAAAFANYRLWESIGFVMTYGYQNSMKTKKKVYVCMAFLISGMLGYAIVEFMERKKQRKKSRITDAGRT